MALPTRLQEILGKTELVYSLKTKSYQIARQRCRMASNKIEQLLEKALLMPNPTREQLEDIIQTYFKAIHKQYVEGFLLSGDTSIGESIEAHTEDLRLLKSTRLSSTVYKSESEKVLGLFQKAGLDTPQNNSPEFTKVLTGIRDAQIEVERLIIAKLRDDYKNGKPIGQFAIPSPTFSLQLPAQSSMTLSELIKKYAEHAKLKNKGAEGIKDRLGRLRNFTKLIGKNKQIAEITIDDITNYMAFLRTKRNSVIKKNPPIISPKTQSQYMMDISALFNIAKGYKYIPDSPYSAILHEIDVPTKDGSPREIFTKSRIKQFFGSAQYLSRGKQSGIFWVPLIGLYTGARESEIVYLQTEDIDIELGLIDFRRKPKTKSSSIRIVPMHSNLIELGLLDFVKSQKDKYLFPDLMRQKTNPQKLYKNPEKEFYKKFKEDLEASNIKQEEIVFHSFRNTLITKLEETDASPEIANLYVGHASMNKMRKHYSKAKLTNKLRTAIEKVDYGINWQELLQKNNET